MGIRSVLEADFDYDIVEEFLDHYSIMIDLMGALIVDLGKEGMYKRSLDEFLKIIHNIKTSSDFLKIKLIYKLADFVEKFLLELPPSYEKMNDETQDWLLAISDMFMQWRDDINNDSELTPLKFSLLKIPDAEHR